MPDHASTVDRDALLAAATTPAERAEILGLDWPRIRVASRNAVLATIGLMAITIAVIAPISVQFSAMGRALPQAEGAELSFLHPLLAVAPYFIAFIAGQAVLRAGRKWTTRRQQVVAVSVFSATSTLLLAPVALLLRDEPSGSIAMLLAGSLGGWLTLLVSTSLALGLWRGAPTLGFTVDQNRTLPAGSTLIEGRVAPLFGRALVATTHGILIAALIWLNPALAIPVAVVFTAVELSADRLTWAGRTSAALGVAWLFAGLLATAVFLAI